MSVFGSTLAFIKYEEVWFASKEQHKKYSNAKS